MSTQNPHSLPRFLVPELGREGDRAVLPAAESHHLARVLRLVGGNRIAVFDGKGREFVARIDRSDRTAASVTLLAPLEPAAEPRVPFALVQALLKGTAMDDVVRDATMLGAATIEPVVTTHVVKKGFKPAAVDRWQRVALASVKQCRRAVVPGVAPIQRFEDWLKSSHYELRLLFVEPSSSAEPRSLKSLMGGPPPASAALVVGPEGGWNPPEIQSALAAGCTPVTLGSLTLRADAVAIAAASVFRFLWDE
jgi:16S rRNA (uracil1498-N3)-methyltransferase